MFTKDASMSTRLVLIIGLTLWPAVLATAQPAPALPDGAVARLGGALLAPDAISGIAFSPDGASLAASSKNTLIIFDTASGKERRRWVAHKSAIEAIAF